MLEVFVAYASGNGYHSEIIRKASEAASTTDRKILPWAQKDTSGFPIAESVESWIQRADAFIADISSANDNVTYELGFAIGLAKPVRLIRSEHVNFQAVQDIGLLDTLGHDSYGLELTLTKIFKKRDENAKWPEVHKNKDQPIFILQPPRATGYSLRLTSAVKKTARLRFRNFNPSEISRLSASEAYEQATSSYGVCVFWIEGDDEKTSRNNQRAAFIYGVAKGRGIPALLLAPEDARLPLDLQDQATRWTELSDFENIIRQFRDEVADLQVDFVEVKPHDGNILEQISCGDPTAENEATGLSEYFLETESYRRALDGVANILVGRKGSGKTAVFLQVRDRSRADKENIVIDLIPDGHQLVKMKEFILDQLGLGSRKEVVAAFWQYVLWLEIAYKLLEKDHQKAYRDSRLLKEYKKLEELFNSRVDTGAGDFSERLRLLSTNIIERFEKAKEAGAKTTLESSSVIEIIYGQDIHQLRETVLSYLRLKGFVYFLLDNLDRFWTPGGFDEDDALIVVGLVEAMQEITRRFAKSRLDFRWAIFIRSDVYEFLIRGMADYGKLSIRSLEWSDRELLKVLFQRRIESGVSRMQLSWSALLKQISIASVDGKPVMDFLIDGSLMRPRYLIRLFETARRRAITFGRRHIEEADYLAALKETGWQVVEDLDREIADLVPNSTDLLFEIIQSGKDLTAAKFRYLAGKQLTNQSAVEKLLEVMLWNGSLGVLESGALKYIFDSGYKRQYLSALIKADPEVQLCLHPTLSAIN